ncbi:MAG: ABC transporter substrate-binding protein [Prevotella sp.]|nr:ABC transporter substrate-binding protein [Prevotella sp.]
MKYIAKNQSWRFVLILVVALVFASCRGNRSQSDVSQGDTLALKYATLLHVVKHAQYTTVSIDNPWKEGQTLHRYVLIDRNAPMPDNLPVGDVIRVPVQKAVVFTTAHCQLLQFLGADDCIAGVCDSRYMVLPTLLKRVADGQVVDCGDGMNPMVEKIIDLQPDVMLLSPFENTGGYGKVEEIEIPYLECADYMEPTALGRAEWMKFYGMLFGKQAQAERLFIEVDSAYRHLTQQAAALPKGRSIITERKTGSVWYVAGGKSVIGQVIRDANAGYAFADNDKAGSLSLPFEAVLDKAGDTDLWLFKYNGDRPFTYADLMAEYQGYSQLKAVREHQVYACNSSKVPFFEETPFRPDWLLRDFIILSHPDLSIGSPKYYTKIKE